MAATDPRSLFGACVGLFLALGCDFSALDSDPSSWNPREEELEEPEAAEPETELEARCSEVALSAPFTLPELSTKTTQSHAVGTPCLSGCHEEGGTSSLIFEVAGSAYATEGSRKAASPGKSIFGVAGSTVTIDSCGNFYAVRAALAASAKTTQPFVRDPTFHKMEKSMNLARRPGDCNQSGCHDFSESGTSGIFF